MAEMNHEEALEQWRENVRQMSSSMNSFLGDDWELDKAHEWRYITSSIIEDRYYDSLIGVLDTTLKMMKLLAKAEDFIVTKKEMEPPIMDTRTMNDKMNQTEGIDSDSSIFDGLTVPELTLYDNGMGNLDSAENLSLELGIMDEKNNESPVEIVSTAPLKRDGDVSKPRDRRKNVMMFLPGCIMNSCSYEKEVENILTYLGCEKSSIQDIEIVRDGGDRYSVLRVEMDSVREASRALANAYKLKNYLGPIFIAKDMTFCQRMKMRELVKTLRECITLQPMYRWKIIDWEVVKVGVFQNKGSNGYTDETESLGPITIPSTGSNGYLNERIEPLSPIPIHSIGSSDSLKIRRVTL